MTPEDLGIQSLDPNHALQLLTLRAPVMPYGTFARTSHMPGTIHFYTEDRKFTRLFARPERILMTGCSGLVEPNCSSFNDLPLITALYGIYRKRAVARYWQACGIPVSVDLNVDDYALPYALLGVPRGWRSYSARSHRNAGPDAIVRRLRIAQEHAGDNDVAFYVFGGGKKIRKICDEHGLTYVPEHMRVVRGIE